MDAIDDPARRPLRGEAGMMPYARVLLLAGAAVLLYDGLMSIASVRFGFGYGSTPVVLGSSSIYAGAGFFGARVRRRLRAGVLAGAVAGMVDSTLGLLLSALIVPAYPGGATPPAITVVVVAVTCMGAVCGLIGGLIGRRR
jgi:hypothetical protein